MNITNFQHAVQAFIFQVIIGLLTGDWFAGACLSIGIFLGREHAQMQAHLKTTSTIKGLDIRKWTLDSKLDLLFPIIINAIVCIVVYILTGSLYTKGIITLIQ